MTDDPPLPARASSAPPAILTATMLFAAATMLAAFDAAGYYDANANAVLGIALVGAVLVVVAALGVLYHNGTALVREVRTR